MFEVFRPAKIIAIADDRVRDWPFNYLGTCICKLERRSGGRMTVENGQCIWQWIQIKSSSTELICIILFPRCDLKRWIKNRSFCSLWWCFERGDRTESKNDNCRVNETPKYNLFIVNHSVIEKKIKLLKYDARIDASDNIKVPKSILFKLN